jgi:hypothetical protein
MMLRAIFVWLPSEVRKNPALCARIFHRTEYTNPAIVYLRVVLWPYLRPRPLLWLVTMFASAVILGRLLTPFAYWPLLFACVIGYVQRAEQEIRRRKAGDAFPNTHE